MSSNVEANRIAIVHDSGAALPNNLRISDYSSGLAEVPLSVIVDYKNGEMKEWIDAPLSDSRRIEFLNDLKSAEISTSQPNTEAYFETYSKLIENGYKQIVTVPMGGKFSGSINSARLAAQEIGDRAKILIPDCNTVSIEQGLLVSQAIIENNEHKFNDAQELANRIDYLSGNLSAAQGFASLNTLRKSGRIGLLQSMFGIALGYNAIVSVKNGELVPIGKERGWSHTCDAMIDHIRSKVGERAVRLAILYFAAEQSSIDLMRKKIDASFNIATDSTGKRYEIVECEEPQVLAAKSGPYVIGASAIILDQAKAA
jgi:DegV family protein with EDD domain